MIKTILLIILIPFILIYNQNTNAKANFKVEGVCGMCKVRIENSTIKLKGVKQINWSIQTGVLDVIYNEKKINLNKIHEFIAGLGHDTDKIKANDKNYSSLDPCCKYRDPSVVTNHTSSLNN